MLSAAPIPPLIRFFPMHMTGNTPDGRPQLFLGQIELAFYFLPLSIRRVCKDVFVGRTDLATYFLTEEKNIGHGASQKNLWHCCEVFDWYEFISCPPRVRVDINMTSRRTIFKSCEVILLLRGTGALHAFSMAQSEQNKFWNFFEGRREILLILFIALMNRAALVWRRFPCHFFSIRF